MEAVNPVMQTFQEVAGDDDHLVALGHWTWCPGCKQVHRFRSRPSEPYTEADPEHYWDWDGNETLPTFSPSLLVYYTVDLCPPDFEHIVPCPANGACGQISHAVMDGSTPRRLGHVVPHAVPLGNCHSFLRAGVWEFLGDSAHALAGQYVPMAPLPDWLVRA